MIIEPGQDELVGRDVELRVACGALRRDRIVWITGYAGVGRSRLATEIGCTLAADYPDGIARLDLADADRPPVADETELVSEISRAIGLALPAPEVADLIAALAGKRHLLLLEDADGLGLDPVLSAIRQTAGCAVLITAVSPPSDPAGSVVSLGPLPVPDPVPDLDQPADFDQVAANPAVRLFARVAERTDPGFVLDPNTARQVVRICRSVDGIPLALELAASRTRLLGVAVLADKLADGAALGLLRRGDQGAEAALGWSYRQLPAGAQAVLRRLGCFAGPFSFEAAVAVCAKGEDDLLEHLTRLVDLHLLQRTPATDPPADADPDVGSFVLSPLLREFARAELGRSSDLFEVGRLHAEYHAAVARRIVLDIDDARDTLPHRRMRRGYPDIALAEEWYASQDQPVEALRIAVDRAAVASYLADPIEFVRHLEGLLRQVAPRGLPPDLRSDVLLRLAQLRYDSTESIDALRPAHEAWEEGIALARKHRFRLLQLRGLRTRAIALPITGDFDTTAAVLEEGREIAEEIGHVPWLARFEGLIGMLHHQRRDFEAAVAYGTSALHRALRAGDRRALITVGALLYQVPPGTRPELPLLPPPTELYRFARELGDPEAEEIIATTLGTRAIMSGDASEAAYWVSRRVRLLRSANVWRGAGYVFVSLAHIARLVGDPAAAAWFHGVVVSRMSLLLGGMPPTAATAYQALVEDVRSDLGEVVFDREVSRGSLLRWPEVVDRARAYADRIAVPPESPARFEASSLNATAAPSGSEAEEGLSARERQVLALMVEGRTNKEIGIELRISAKTVMHHSGHIYRKLGVRGRAEAAVVAVRTGLLDQL